MIQYIDKDAIKPKVQEKLLNACERHYEAERALQVTVRSDIHKALKDQGLEYRDGVIVEVEQKKEPQTEFECGYKQAIEDAVRYMDKVWGLNILGNSINDFRETMEQKLKELSQG